MKDEFCCVQLFLCGLFICDGFVHFRKWPLFSFQLLYHVMCIMILLVRISIMLHIIFFLVSDCRACIKDGVIGIVCACPGPVTLMAYFINLFAFMESSDCRLCSLVSTLQFSETPLNFCIALGGTQFYDMHWSWHSFKTYLSREHSLMTCPCRNPVLQHTLGRAQYYDIPVSVLIKSITYYIFPCLRMFPQFTPLYLIGNCTNLTLRV